MLKKSLVILLLASPFLRAEQECEDALKGKNKCGKFRSLTVCNNTTTGSLTVTGNETVGGTLNVAGSASVGGPLLIGGVAALTALRSYGQAFANAAQATGTAPITWVGGSNLNTGVSVAGTGITLANAGIYYVRYSVVFTLVTPLASGVTTSGSVIPLLGGFAIPGTAEYIETATFGGPVTVGPTFSVTGPAAGSTLEVSGGFFVQTLTPSNILSILATLGTGVELDATTAPAANATVEIIQVN